MKLLNYLKISDPNLECIVGAYLVCRLSYVVRSRKVARRFATHYATFDALYAVAAATPTS